jgi:DNA repair protein RadD
MFALRPYQQKLEDDIDRAWANGARTVLTISPTGSGKTVTFGNILRRETVASAAIAHRRELVSQMSLTLARNGVRHRVIGPKSLRNEIVAIHMADVGRSYYDSTARCGVVGIDSLPGLNSSDPWLQAVQLAIGDEGHHFLRENKWGRGIAMFPNLKRTALFTATGWRADGRGLGAETDGLADAMVLGPTMGELIDMGYLTPYRVVAPPSDVDYSGINVTDSGDLSPVKLRAAVHKSNRIVGDIVSHYLKFARGKLGVTFAVDVAAAIEIAEAYRRAGVPAEVVSAETPDTLRMHILGRFRRREILQLVNVDLFGEGFDLPAVEVISMGRKTESKGLFDQQFGRVLRLMIGDVAAAMWDTFTDAERRALIASSDKPYGLIIDHVGNVERHLPPDAPRYHTLDRRERASRGAVTDAIPVRTCLNPECVAVYERTEPKCPYCGLAPVVTERTAAEYVDGDLVELDAAVLAAMTGRVREIDGAVRIPQGLSGPAAQAVKNRHLERQHAQRQLREAIALWAGWQRDQGREQREQHKRFYFMFGIDVLTAQTLGRPEAEALYERIQGKLIAERIVAAPIDGTVSKG